MPQNLRIGLGYDTHRLVEGASLVLGGVQIPHTKGMVSHSDGDALTHALIDALLGAAELGDLGTHFPSEDDQYKGIESLALLKQTLVMLGAKRLRPLQIDAVVIAQKPMLRPHLPAIKENLTHILMGCRVNIKATTSDGLGFIGREEGIAAQVVAMLKEI